MAEGLVHRVNARQRNAENRHESDEEFQKGGDDEVLAKYKSKRSKFTLMEELLLLSIKDDSGETFFFSNTLSYALRACILIELAVKGRIELEQSGARRRSSQRRNLIVSNSSGTGEPLLDEALRILSESPQADTIPGWLDLLSGETWNPLFIKYQMRQVRSRICKGLVEKGVCSSTQQNYVLFNLTVHPLSDPGAKAFLFNYFNSLLLQNWVDIPSIDPRDFALLAISHSTCVAENALSILGDNEYSIAWERLRNIGDLDPEKEILKLNQNPIEAQTARSKIMQVIYACKSAVDKL